MGCGCKKNKNTEVVNQPAEVNVTVDQSQPTQPPTLTEEQQKTVDAIIAKLNQLNS
jgi:hypothetical protein